MVRYSCVFRPLQMSFSTERDREIPLPSASFLHKASFGSFSSFPEFSRAR